MQNWKNKIKNTENLDILNVTLLELTTDVFALK